MTSANEPVQIEYQPCIVSFIDVLGFRNLIRSRTAAEIHRTISLLQEFTAPLEPSIHLEDTSISTAHTQSVSDAIVRVRPFVTRYRDGAFFHELLDLLHAQIELVGEGVLIRAGLTVGNAYVGGDPNSPIFGPAMVRAYEIESQEAVFPRIVVDDEAIREHRLNPQLRSEHNTLEYEIEAIEDLLATGEDGIRYIDYLRASTSEFDHLGGYLDFLNRHASLIRNAQARQMDLRTARKYEWLRRYHNNVITELLARHQNSEELQRSFFEDFETEAIPFFEELLIPTP